MNDFEIKPYSLTGPITMDQQELLSTTRPFVPTGKDICGPISFEAEKSFSYN